MIGGKVNANPTVRSTKATTPMRRTATRFFGLSEQGAV